MHEFETFVYLDMEKTGSSFISALLRKYSAEREIRRKHHAPMTRKCDRSKFHFISVRDPLDCYLSLYSFGCMFRGKLHGHLEAEDLSSKFYNGTEDGFNAWLKYVLKPSNAEKLGDGYGGYNGAIARLMGFQSYRYLRLALPGGMGPLSKCKDRKEVRALRAEESLSDFTIRHESFVADLCDLLSGPLKYKIKDLDEALHYVKATEPKNASQRVDSGKPDFGPNEKMRARLRHREWLLHELFNY